MALSVFLQGAKKLPVLNGIASSLFNTQLKNSNRVLTPFITKSFSGLNRPIVNAGKLCGLNGGLPKVQSRSLSHSQVWTAEKLLSIALVAIIPACIAAQTTITDNILAAAVVLHMHWGVEAVVVDYIRPSLVGKTIPGIAHSAVFVVSIITLCGLLYFNFNDIGVSRAVHRLWQIKGN